MKDASITPVLWSKPQNPGRADHHIPSSRHDDGLETCEHSEHLVLRNLRYLKTLVLSWRNEKAGSLGMQWLPYWNQAQDQAGTEKGRGKRQEKTWPLLIYLKNYGQLYMKPHLPLDFSVIWANKVYFTFWMLETFLFCNYQNVRTLFFFLKDLLGGNNNNSQISGRSLMWEYF